MNVYAWLAEGPELERSTGGYGYDCADHVSTESENSFPIVFLHPDARVVVFNAER